MATGSDIALLCGFRVTQARAARQERQQQEGQTRVANLATLFPDWETFQTASATSNCQKPLRTKLATFFLVFGRRLASTQRYFSNKSDVITSRRFASLASNGGCCELSAVLKHLWRSLPLRSQLQPLHCRAADEPTNLSLLIKSDILTFDMLTHIESNIFICTSE